MICCDKYLMMNIQTLYISAIVTDILIFHDWYSRSKSIPLYELEFLCILVRSLPVQVAAIVQ